MLMQQLDCRLPTTKSRNCQLHVVVVVACLVFLSSTSSASSFDPSNNHAGDVYQSFDPETNRITSSLLSSSSTNDHHDAEEQSFKVDLRSGGGLAQRMGGYGDDGVLKSHKVRKELGANGELGYGGVFSPDATAEEQKMLVQECLRAVNNCTNTQDTLLIHVALFLLSDRKWRPQQDSDQVKYVLQGCDKYEKFIQCVEMQTSAAQFGSQECFELSGFSDSFGFRWHRCSRFKRWLGVKNPKRRHSRSRYYFRRHGRMRI